jgi:cellulose synthase/poly-beta-1,6-N-acetylglucosamine synthase-like glycosyltransferase/peptidoglycan/xylan/chitin deacetylase (PgdA/CDA1 family)/spore germination protein YaaH
MKDPIAENTQDFVFHDPHGRRWPRLRRILVLLGIAVFLGIVLFVQALFVSPQLRIPASVRKLKGQLKALQQQQAAQHRTAAEKTEEQSWLKFYPRTAAGQERIAKLRELIRPKPEKFSEIRLGFYANWDANSYDSLEKHADELTHVCPDWMSLTDGLGTLAVDDDPRVSRLAAARGLVLMPLLTNLVDDIWQPEAVEGLAMGPEDRQNQFIVNLLSQLEADKAGGVVVDWEGLDPQRKTQITDLLIKMADALHAVDKELWVEVQMGDEFNVLDLERLAEHADHYIAMLTDETSDDDPPGPIASQDWFEGWLSVLAGYGEPDLWIGAIGAYGYDWTDGAKLAETISFADAMSRASYSNLPRVDSQTPMYNPLYSYQEPTKDHTVCFLDAITFLNQLRSVRAAGLGGFAVVRLGQEDPQIWDVLGFKDTEHPAPEEIAKLNHMQTSDTISNVGQGEIVTVDDTRDDGDRTVTLDKNGRYSVAYGSDFPTYPSLYHQGAGGEHEVALTFDDGPDPTWTPMVLDILKRYNVKATFFLVGSQAEQYPDLVRRIIAEGHLVGNHTYTHANLAELTPEQVELELNATQRLIESITGRSTTLFRPPYDADSRPAHIDELVPLKQVQDLGYLIVLESIDPEDWARPGADVILDRVKELRKVGSLILLHDAGGDRSQTVKALPQIIDWLQTRGDTIVPLSQLLQIPYEYLMPPVARSADPLTLLVTGSGFRIWHVVVEFCWAFMIAATALIVLRTIMVAVLAAQHFRRVRKLDEVEPYTPPISVIIAAYNEEKVIAATLRAVTDTSYTGEFEVVVIDDGSKDQTVREIEKAAFVNRRIRLLKQPNGGKSEALRHGVTEAQYDTLVFLDADTHFDRDTFEQLVKPLRDPKVGAVSGHAKVGNLRTFIARCQSLEYICGFNLDRRAYAQWNCITVVPGAVSAIRRQALEDAGGFCSDTLAEDTDLTLCLHRSGYRVEYAPGALAWTEAPEGVRPLMRQRFRWAFGTLQCLWKHRDLVFNPQYGALGWFSLPSIWFFQIVLVALTPVVDGLLVVSLILGGWSAMWSYVLIFLLMDLILAFLACGLDGEKLRKGWTILPMRIIYRPLLSWVIWKALYRAFKGAWVTWGKTERTASMPVRVG